MDTKYKTERMERKAPDISVCAHVDETTTIDVTPSGNGGVCIGVKGWSYPSLTLFMTREKMAEMLDLITVYLGDDA